jgi:hypothetical protein
MAKPETSTRPNFGTTTEITPGTRTITTTRPDGTQTVETVPVQPKR